MDLEHQKGYTVKAHYITCPVDTALAANKKRFDTNPEVLKRRLVPNDDIINAHIMVSKNFTKLAPLFDELELISNDKVHKTSQIAQKDTKTGKLIVTNESEYQKFLNLLSSFCTQARGPLGPLA